MQTVPICYTVQKKTSVELGHGEIDWFCEPATAEALKQE